jgi:hypothetical protein
MERGMNIKFTSRGIPELLAYLDRIQRGLKGKTSGWVAEYLVGDMSHGLKHYVPYKYVTVEQAGGWKSDKQRRYVMAMIREGKIDPGAPHRTGELQRGWEYADKGTRWTITNETPYAGYVMGDNDQANMQRLIGWRVVSEVIQSNLKGAFRFATAKLKEWLREQKKQ